MELKSPSSDVEDKMELKSLCVGGSRVRPCDSCGQKQSRWFCAADDAYLCNICDNSVHSANSVACRHERVKLSTGVVNLLDSRSSWSRKRSRSERSHKPKQHSTDLVGIEAEDLDLDLELGSLIGRGSHDEQDDQLRGLEWLFDRVKVEVEDGNLKFDEPFDLNVNFLASDVEEENVNLNLDVGDVSLSGNEEKKICLKLNYEDVLSAWCGRGSPWADQNSFHAFLDDSGSEATAGLEYGVVPDLNVGNGGCEQTMVDVPVTQSKSSRGFREARVMRYREKRRSRLFSKRIRYHVRKLNAEQRPRMKGRFVKKEPEIFLAHKHMR